MSSLQDLLAEIHSQWQALALGSPKMHPIEMCFFLNAFELGIRIYEQLEHKTPEDDCWVGQCYYGLGRSERCREHLMKAAQHGNVLARIYLARANAYAGWLKEAENDLQDIEPQGLPAFVRAAWYDAMNVLQTRNLNHQEALRWGQMAWRHIQGTEEFTLAAPRLLSKLAQTCGLLRLNQQCLYYLKRAEEICVTSYVWELRLNMAIHLFEQGRFEESRDLLIRCQDHLSSDMTRLLCLIIKSRIQLIFGDLEGSIQAIEQTSQRAEETMHSSLACLEYACLSNLYAFTGQHFKAALCLTKAEHLISEPDDQLQFQMRRLYNQYIQGQVQHPGLLEEMHRIVEARREDGDLLEDQRAQMFYCEFLVGCRSHLADEAVDQMVQHFVNRDCVFFGSEEWVLLPELRSHLKVHHPEFMERIAIRPREILIFTINREEVVFDGSVVAIPLKKTIEILVYLLMHQKASISEINSRVLADYPGTAARNYFHQVKYLLNERLGILRIEYDRTSRRYFLHSDFQVQWDLKPYLEGQKKLEGIFLPSSGSDWVIELNQRLSG